MDPKGESSFHDLRFESEEQAAKEILVKFEGRREFSSLGENLVTMLAVAASLYHLYYAYFHPFFALDHRALHWLFLGSLAFILYPCSKKRSPLKRMSVLDWLFMLASAAICIWIFVDTIPIMNRAGAYRTSDMIFSTIFLLLVLEAARRSTGPSISLIALVFMAYALFGPYLPKILAHRAYSLTQLSTYLSLSTDGIFGVPMGVSASFILLFILYGAVLNKTGAGKFFTDVAFALTGWSRGGPAKAAVISSTFFGMISGSSVANTVTCGSFTIPLMKKTGYPAAFAGGVEASSGTMGQIMPPVMGAGAFIMAEFLGISYFKVCVAAAIPALLAFFSNFMQVHYKAVSIGLEGIPRADLPRIRAAFAEGWYHLFSIFLLIYFLGLNYSPERAVFWAIVASIASSLAVTLVKKEPLRDFGAMVLSALREGAVGSIQVAAACGAAGIIIGSITMTGLGVMFSSMVVDASMGHLYLALPFTMMACLFLGMGVPTTAQYIIVATLVAPALVQMGILAISAHLFVFYFSTRADITPPVALAAYAAAGIARSNPWKTGLHAFQLGIVGFIVPYMFIYSPELLCIGSWPDIGLAVVTAVIGVVCLAAAVQQCMIVQNRWYETALLTISAFLLIKPGIVTDLIGLILMIPVCGAQWLRKRNISKIAVAPAE